MAPIKFEDNLREKLEGREISPSNDAWNRLSKQLDANSEKKTNKVIWYAIAASLIGILIAVSVFNSRNDKAVENTNDFVNLNTTESEVGEIDEIKSGKIASEIDEKVIIASEEVKAVHQIEQTNSEIKQVPKKKDAIVDHKKQQTTEAIAKVSSQSQNEQMTQLPMEDVAKVDLIIDKKINELVAKVELLQQNNETVSVDEIEALLAQAAQDIRSQKILNSTKIDPTTLLGDVELELDNSFRNKIFNALGDGYDIIKTAVVNRNN